MSNTDPNVPTLPTTARQPSSRLTNRSRSAADLTNRPIIVYGIRVPDNDPELASVMKTVANLAIIIAFLQLASFMIIFINGEYAEQAGAGESSITLASGLFTLIVFGCCVPIFGYLGAKKNDINALSLFCFGEGMVAVFGGCEFLMTVLAITTYLNACTSKDCVYTFKNSSATKCEFIADHDQTRTYKVERSVCEEILSHPGFWSMVVVSGLIVCVGAAATKYSMILKTNIIEKKQNPMNNNVHVVPVGGVVATTSIIQSGTQHYNNIQNDVTGSLNEIVDGEDDIPRAQVVVESQRRV